LLKAIKTPKEIKVGLNNFKSLKNCKVLIETNSKEDIEVLERTSAQNVEEIWKLTVIH